MFVIALRDWRVWSAALCVCLMGSGCARGPRETVGHLWDHAPTGKHASKDDLQAEPLSTVTANTPSVVEPSPATAEEPAAEVEIADGPRLTIPAHAEADRGVAEIRSEREKEPGGPKIWDPRMVSAAAESTVNRLKRALSSDAKPDAAPVDPLSRNHPLRVRVDALHQKAVKFFEEGDLQEAKVQAERAVDLSESLALEFLPNEEHPEDLLRRIMVAIDERDQAPAEVVPTFPTDDAKLGQARLPEEPVLPLTDALRLDAEPLSSRFESMGTVAANRPLRLPSASEAEATEVAPPPLGDMNPISRDELHQTSLDGAAEGGLTAPTTADRLRFRGESGPLTLPVERRPQTQKVADVAPLPAFRATVAPRPAPVEPTKAATAFEWSDLWPLAVLGALLGFFALGLVGRRIITGH